nr:PTS glucose transporter subunit IIA [Actinoalloteichus hymeniacidonis]
MRTSVLSPVNGRVVSLTEVPDEVFAQAVVGPGIAVEPEDEEASTAVAPIGGVIAALHPHAFVVTAPTGVSILVHLGIDTVRLKGAGFTLHAAKGDTVQAGQKLIDWSPTAIRGEGLATVCPVIALDAAPESLLELHADGPVATGEELFACRP